MAVNTFLCDGGRCADNFTCASNRVAAEDNPLCGQCQPGYSEWGGACVACSGVNGGLVLGLLLLAWACVLAIHSFAQRASTSSSLRIAMFFWQVSFLVVGGTSWLRCLRSGPRLLHCRQRLWLCVPIPYIATRRAGASAAGPAAIARTTRGYGDPAPRVEASVDPSALAAF
jgi:hypothetical protein